MGDLILKGHQYELLLEGPEQPTAQELALLAAPLRADRAGVGERAAGGGAVGERAHVCSGAPGTASGGGFSDARRDPRIEWRGDRRR